MSQGLVTLSPGSLFAGDFRVIRPLAGGGMGAVYVVEQTSTGKHRALKVMHPQMLQDERLRERFVQESRIGSRIESDHVVEVVGAGIDSESDTPWLAMELLKGEDLLSAVRRGGPISPSDLREVYAQLCHAIAAAHDAGIVHRDLKPDNVFLASPRRVGVPFTVKVLDFGIAKVIAEAQTRHTQAIGTPLWMAPEQTESGQPVRPAADVWALGLVAFYLLVGRPYWKSPNSAESSPVSLLREVAIEPLVPASERAALFGLEARIPEGFDAWFAQCVTRSIEKRFSTARAAFAALAPLLADTKSRGETSLADRLRSLPQSSTPLPISHTTPERPVQQTLPMTVARPRRRAMLGATIGAIVVLVTASIVWIARRESEPDHGSAMSEKTQRAVTPATGDDPMQPSASSIAKSGVTTDVPSGTSVVAGPKPKVLVPTATAPTIELKFPPWPTVTTTTTGTDPPPIGTAPPPTGTVPPIGTSDPPPKTTEGFDKVAAKNSMQSIAYKDCGTGGPGTVSVVFGPKGNAQSAYVTSGAYDDPTKVCVGQRFAKAKVPPFDGAPVPVVMTIDLPPK